MAGLAPRALRWAVLWARLDPVEGHEQAGQRPVLVVSYEPFHPLGLLTVAPITAARVIPRFPGDVLLPDSEGPLPRTSIIVCSQIRTLSVARVLHRRDDKDQDISYVTSPAIRRQVREALAHHLALDVRAPVDGAEGAATYAATQDEP